MFDSEGKQAQSEELDHSTSCHGAESCIARSSDADVTAQA